MTKGTVKRAPRQKARYQRSEPIVYSHQLKTKALVFKLDHKEVITSNIVSTSSVFSQLAVIPVNPGL